MKYFEDVKIGEHHVLGDYTFEQDSMLEFARAYDSQLVHADPDSVEASVHGSIIASPWQITSVWMRTMVDFHRKQEEPSATSVSPGFLSMEFFVPVKPGDTLTYENSVYEKVDLESRPNMGIVRMLNRGTNQDGKEAFRFIGQVFMEKRPLD